MYGITTALLAKSGTPEISLDEHTRDVEDALQQILMIWPALPKVLLKAARFHDFGKAADGFQQMLLPPNPPWAYRHEVLSAAIFRTCFSLDDLDVQRAYLALLSHHKNFLDSDQKVKMDFRQCQSSTVSGAEHWRKKWNELDVYSHRSLFEEELSQWQFDPNIASPANEVSLLAYSLSPVFENKETALCRGALVAADHLASAKLGTSILGKNINAGALTKYAKSIPMWTDWTAIQKRAGQITGSAILTAPTGSGKTEAALLWALNNRIEDQQFARVFYVLPYQVSINAMAERLSRVFPDEEQNTELHKNATVSALHGNTALAYLRSAMNDKSQEPEKKPSQEEAIEIAQKARDAVRQIYSPLKVTTVYQLLDIFFGRKFFEVGLLELTNSLVIFDEIHAYDGHTLGLIMVLLDCLERLGAKVFIMTATLPPVLNEWLREAAKIAEENCLSLVDIAQEGTHGSDTDNGGQKDAKRLLEEIRRVVRLYPDTNILDLVPQIREAVQTGKRVAVVCNTVRTAISLADQLNDLGPMLVHSRFTIGHRAERETKENLQERPFVIATQVIEVSMDVSFDMMFTEVAPIDDLLQRFGRVNRHELHDPWTRGICHIALAEDSGSEMIYTEELLRATRTVLMADAERNEQGEYWTKPLDYLRTCQWVQSVYPNGLTSEEEKAMSSSKGLFEGVVNNLRPMVDAPDVDLERSLFRSVQVVPAKYANEWQKLKAQKRHLQANELIVNIDERVWNGCCSKDGDAAKDTILCGTGKYQKKQIIALYPYEADTMQNGKNLFDGLGLQLRQPTVSSPILSSCFIDNDED